MLLAVDAGNSMVKFAVFSGEKVVARFAESNETAIDLPRLQAHLREQGAPPVSAIAIASVGPHADALLGMLQPLAPHSTVRLHTGLELGVVNRYEHPASVGIDRLLNTIAAHSLYGGPIVVADIGTATNFECVGTEGEFLGGAICAGPQLCLNALGARSKQLLSVSFERPSTLIATNTSDALKSGAFYGHAHLVSGLLRQFQSALGDACKSVVTGGYAPKLFPSIAGATYLNPDLTLHGVRLAFERVTQPPSQRR